MRPIALVADSLALLFVALADPGLFTGSALGALDGLRKKGIVGGKLRWNAVLNGASMRGTYYGNTAGTLGASLNLALARRRSSRRRRRPLRAFDDGR